MESVRYARPEGDRVIGRVTYFLLFVALAVLFGLPAAGLGAWVAARGNVADPWFLAIPAVFALGTTGLTGWGLYRSFRRRAYGAIVFGPEHIEIEGPDERVELPYAEVDVVRFLFQDWHPTVEVRTSDGRAILVPPDLVPLGTTLSLLEKRLLPRMLSRMERGLAGGGAWPLLERRANLLAFLVQGSAMLLFSVPLLLVPSMLVTGWETVWTRFASGMHALRGPLEVTPDGLRRAPGPVVRWKAMTLVRLDELGFVIRTADGRTLEASSLAENFWPLSRLVQRRVQAAPPTMGGGAAVA